MICQDEELLHLAMKEISVMKSLKGHPNVVTLVAHSTMDMGRRKEALLVMEFCEKSLVAVLENRGTGYFEEKQILLIFRDVCNAVFAMHCQSPPIAHRDVCNAVFAMHCQSPPIAHRDLKAENVLLGSDGAWKLCDFGSTSTNHKCFDRPEEMGIEEDNIRKHTTPAYRAPEMWDLYRRDVISEKADIWALGCLLYRICYFKLAFDGESKLQILNGNYRIPEVPKYSASITSLIKDMLESSPDARPDITQVWFRVNELLPAELQKDLPDGSTPASAVDKHSPASNVHDEAQRKSPIMPRRSPPPPPSREQTPNISPQYERDVHHSKPSHGTSKVSSTGGPVGAFWSTQHAQDSQVTEDKAPLFDDEPISQVASKDKNADFEIRFSPEKKPSHTDTKLSFQNESFNTFVADFNVATNTNKKSREEEELEEEVVRLREQLKQSYLEKVEIASKYEKLSAICRSQRQELQELKRALAASTPSPSSKESPKIPETPQQREKIEGTVWEQQEGMYESSSFSPPNPKPWNAFANEPKQQQKQQTTTSKIINPKSVRTATNGHRNISKPQTSTIPSTDEWGFGHNSFKAGPSGGVPVISRSSVEGRISEGKKAATSQPAGWAGF